MKALRRRAFTSMCLKMDHHGPYTFIVDCLCSWHLSLLHGGTMACSMCLPVYLCWDCYGSCVVCKQRYRFSKRLLLSVLWLISSIVVVEGLGSRLLNNVVLLMYFLLWINMNGDVYYYNGYSTAVVYYTGHKVIKINGDEQSLG